MINPEAVAFVNTNIRKRCNQLRAIKALIDADLQKWATLSAQFQPAGEPIEDGREAEGVSRLVASDVTAVVNILTQLKTRFDAAGVAAALDKPCVGPLEITVP